jgi:hypothetical protein
MAIHCRLAKLHLLHVKRLNFDRVEEFRATLRVLSSCKNDAALIRCKFALLELKQAAVGSMDVPRACSRLVDAMEQALQLDARGLWIFPRDAASAPQRIVKLQARLRDNFVLLVETISFAPDYDLVLKVVGQFSLLAELVANALPKMRLDDWRLPKFLWLALRLANNQHAASKEAVRDWFASLPRLEFEALTHCVVTDEVAACILRHAEKVESASFRHSIITDAALVSSERFPQTLRCLMLDGCNFVTSDGLIALLKSHPELEQLGAEDCSSLIGDALWRNLGPRLLSLKLNRSLRVSAPTAAFSFPTRLQALELRQCPAISLSVAFVASLPSSLVHFVADDLGAAQAAQLPQNLERLWLSSRLEGGEIHLPRLRSLRLGEEMSVEGLASLCSHSPDLVELDLSHCLHLLDEQKVSMSLRRLLRLEALDVGSNLTLSSDAVVGPLLASGALEQDRLHRSLVSGVGGIGLFAPIRLTKCTSNKGSHLASACQRVVHRALALSVLQRSSRAPTHDIATLHCSFQFGVGGLHDGHGRRMARPCGLCQHIVRAPAH